MRSLNSKHFPVSWVMGKVLFEKLSKREAFLNIPIHELKIPLAVHYQILDEVIYLVTNEEMARQVEDKGRVAYTSEEITALSRVSGRMD